VDGDDCREAAGLDTSLEGAGEILVIAAVAGGTHG
jgi:hypothetical protein